MVVVGGGDITRRQYGLPLKEKRYQASVIGLSGHKDTLNVIVKY